MMKFSCDPSAKEEDHVVPTATKREEEVFYCLLLFSFWDRYQVQLRGLWTPGARPHPLVLPYPSEDYLRTVFDLAPHLQLSAFFLLHLYAWSGLQPPYDLG